MDRDAAPRGSGAESVPCLSPASASGSAWCPRPVAVPLHPLSPSPHGVLSLGASAKALFPNTIPFTVPGHPGLPHSFLGYTIHPTTKRESTHTHHLLRPPRPARAARACWSDLHGTKLRQTLLPRQKLGAKADGVLARGITALTQAQERHLTSSVL